MYIYIYRSISIIIAYISIIIYMIRKVSKVMRVSQARCFGVHQSHPQQVGTGHSAAMRGVESSKGSKVKQQRSKAKAKTMVLIYIYI